VHRWRGDSKFSGDYAWNPNLAIEAKQDQAIEGMRLGVGLLGDPALENTEHIAGVDQVLGPLDALGLLGFVVVDLVGGGNVDPIG
jgi:hypothetical protein